MRPGADDDRLADERLHHLFHLTPETFLLDADGNPAPGWSVGIQLGCGEPAAEGRKPD